MYFAAFRALFRLLSRETGQDIHWQHIHGDGFQTILSDMEFAQLKGI